MDKFMIQKRNESSPNHNEFIKFAVVNTDDNSYIIFGAKKSVETLELLEFFESCRYLKEVEITTAGMKKVILENKDPDITIWRKNLQKCMKKCFIEMKGESK